MKFFALLFVLLGLVPVTVQGETTRWPDGTDPLAGMGVNIHFTDARPGELEMLSQAGFRWIRMDLGWDGTEKTAGVYDFSAYDRLLSSLDKFHIHALLIFDYTNHLYDDGKPSCTDAGRAAFARWAVAAVTHFRDRGVIWEIWNEPNGDWFWKPKPNAEDYAKLALTVSRAIRDAAPNERVVGPALSGTDLDFVRVSAKAGVVPYWAGITIHPYLRNGPENYGAVYKETRQLIKKYARPGQRIDVMCGESGYATTWPGIDESTHGKYLARLFLFDVMSGVPLTIWYDWRDDGTDPKNQEHNFGIVHHDYHEGAVNVYDPKPAYEAAKTYAEELSSFKYDGRMKTKAKSDYVLIFTNAASKCLVAWSAAPGAHEANIPVADGTYSVTNYDGKPGADVATKSGRLTLTLDGGPKYLKLR